MADEDALSAAHELRSLRAELRETRAELHRAHFLLFGTSRLLLERPSPYAPVRHAAAKEDALRTAADAASERVRQSDAERAVAHATGAGVLARAVGPGMPHDEQPRQVMSEADVSAQTLRAALRDADAEIGRERTQAGYLRTALERVILRHSAGAHDEYHDDVPAVHTARASAHTERAHASPRAREHSHASASQRAALMAAAGHGAAASVDEGGWHALSSHSAQPTERAARPDFPPSAPETPRTSDRDGALTPLSAAAAAAVGSPPPRSPSASREERVAFGVGYLPRARLAGARPRAPAPRAPSSRWLCVLDPSAPRALGRNARLFSAGTAAEAAEAAVPTRLVASALADEPVGALREWRGSMLLALVDGHGERADVAAHEASAALRSWFSDAERFAAAAAQPRAAMREAFGAAHEAVCAGLARALRASPADGAGGTSVPPAAGSAQPWALGSCGASAAVVLLLSPSAHAPPSGPVCGSESEEEDGARGAGSAPARVGAGSADGSAARGWTVITASVGDVSCALCEAPHARAHPASPALQPAAGGRLGARPAGWEAAGTAGAEGVRVLSADHTPTSAAEYARLRRAAPQPGRGTHGTASPGGVGSGRSLRLVYLTPAVAAATAAAAAAAAAEGGEHGAAASVALADAAADAGIIDVFAPPDEGGSARRPAPSSANRRRAQEQHIGAAARCAPPLCHARARAREVARGCARDAPAPTHPRRRARAVRAGVRDVRGALPAVVLAADGSRLPATRMLGAPRLQPSGITHQPSVRVCVLPRADTGGARPSPAAARAATGHAASPGAGPLLLLGTASLWRLWTHAELGAELTAGVPPEQLGTAPGLQQVVERVAGASAERTQAILGAGGAAEAAGMLLLAAQLPPP